MSFLPRCRRPDADEQALLSGAVSRPASDANNDDDDDDEDDDEDAETNEAHRMRGRWFSAPVYRLVAPLLRAVMAQVGMCA
jgi:hypothetical protein